MLKPTIHYFSEENTETDQIIRKQYQDIPDLLTSIAGRTEVI